MEELSIDRLLYGLLAVRRNWAVRYAIAVAMVPVALAVRLAIAPAEPGLLPYITFFPAASVVAIVAGAVPGMLTAVLCALLALVWFVPPDMRLSSTVIYLVDAALIAVMAEGVHRILDRLNRAREEAEAARCQAELANAEKTSFLAAVSHDLRQPLQALRLFHTVLADQAGPELAGAVAGMGRALSSGEELLAGIVQLSVLETGQVSAQPVPFPVGEVLAEIVADCAPSAEAAGLKIRWVPSRAVVISDRVLFKRMVRNLVVNAIRYTRSGGVVVGCRRRNGRLVVQVTDTGIGIPADHQQMIFDAFYRVEGQAGDHGKGLGLGLAIVKRLGALLGHGVSVCFEVGKGSTFRIEAEAVRG